MLINANNNESIVRDSVKIVNIYDLGGSDKALKFTVNYFNLV